MCEEEYLHGEKCRAGMVYEATPFGAVQWWDELLNAWDVEEEPHTKLGTDGQAEIGSQGFRRKEYNIITVMH